MEREFKTTFFQDFSIADSFGEKAILDTFNRAFEERKNDGKYFTELVVALNRKLRQHADGGNEKIAKLYEKLWIKADDYACDNFKGDDAKYYYRQTD